MVKRLRGGFSASSVDYRIAIPPQSRRSGSRALTSSVSIRSCRSLACSPLPRLVFLFLTSPYPCSTYFQDLSVSRYPPSTSSPYAPNSSMSSHRPSRFRFLDEGVNPFAYIITLSSSRSTARSFTLPSSLFCCFCTYFSFTNASETSPKYLFYSGSTADALNVLSTA